MSSKQILFNTEMVKAVLDGIKTQTRRVVGDKLLNEIYKNDCYIDDGQIFESCMCQGMPDGSGGLEVDRWEEDVTTTYSKYKVGDILWVREPAKVINYDFPSIGDILNNEAKAKDWVMWYKYLADDKENEILIPERFIYDCTIQAKWITECKGVPNGCIKEMARIFLKVTNVRVERLQDIKYSDMEKEGVSYKDFLVKEGVSINEQFQRNWVNLWNSTAKDGYKWEDNPYVFVYEFERIEKQ